MPVQIRKRPYQTWAVDQIERTPVRTKMLCWAKPRMGWRRKRMTMMVPKIWCG
jgi:hypothetical protein